MIRFSSRTLCYTLFFLSYFCSSSAAHSASLLSPPGTSFVQGMMGADPKAYAALGAWLEAAAKRRTARGATAAEPQVGKQFRPYKYQAEKNFYDQIDVAKQAKEDGLHSRDIPKKGRKKYTKAERENTWKTYLSTQNRVALSYSTPMLIRLRREARVAPHTSSSVGQFLPGGVVNHFKTVYQRDADNLGAAAYSMIYEGSTLSLSQNRKHGTHSILISSEASRKKALEELTLTPKVRRIVQDFNFQRYNPFGKNEGRTFKQIPTNLVSSHFRRLQAGTTASQPPQTPLSKFEFKRLERKTVRRLAEMEVAEKGTKAAITTDKSPAVKELKKAKASYSKKLQEAKAASAKEEVALLKLETSNRARREELQKAIEELETKVAQLNQTKAHLSQHTAELATEHRRIKKQRKQGSISRRRALLLTRGQTQTTIRQAQKIKDLKSKIKQAADPDQRLKEAKADLSREQKNLETIQKLKAERELSIAEAATATREAHKKPGAAVTVGATVSDN